MIVLNHNHPHSMRYFCALIRLGSMNEKMIDEKEKKLQKHQQQYLGSWGEGNAGSSVLFFRSEAASVDKERRDTCAGMFAKVAKNKWHRQWTGNFCVPGQRAETPTRRFSWVGGKTKRHQKSTRNIFVTGEALASKLVQNISNQTKPNCAAIPNIDAGALFSFHEKCWGSNRWKAVHEHWMTIPKFWSKPIPRLFFTIPNFQKPKPKLFSETKFFRNRNRYFSS